MSGSNPVESAPARARRWRVPPPLTRGGELLEGAEVLSEVSGERAVLLWKALRNVTLWASASPQDQAELFAPGAYHRRLAEILSVDLEPALRVPLESLAALLGDPTRARRDSLALACRQVAQWAGSQGHPQTELAFAQAAALACPADAELAWQVGRLSRARGETARAESWFRRTIMLGRQTGNWTAYARAFLNLGIIAKKRGNFPVARRLDVKALRAARRHGLAEVQGMALHELFTIAVECEDASTAQRYAAEAYQAYSRNHPYVRYLAHDLSILWMREGQFSRALPVLRSLAPLFPEEERFLIAANVVRAVGGIGDREGFAAAWASAFALLERVQTHGSTGVAFLSLARGATGVGEWELATTMARRALDSGTATGDGKLVFMAESVLAFAQNRRAVETNVSHNANEPVALEADRLALEMTSDFEAMAGV